MNRLPLVAVLAAFAVAALVPAVGGDARVAVPAPSATPAPAPSAAPGCPFAGAGEDTGRRGGCPFGGDRDASTIERPAPGDAGRDPAARGCPYRPDAPRTAGEGCPYTRGVGDPAPLDPIRERNRV